MPPTPAQAGHGPGRREIPRRGFLVAAAAGCWSALGVARRTAGRRPPPGCYYDPALDAYRPAADPAPISYIDDDGREHPGYAGRLVRGTGGRRVIPVPWQQVADEARDPGYTARLRSFGIRVV